MATKVSKVNGVTYRHTGQAHEFVASGDTVRILKWNPGISYAATDESGAYRTVNVVDVDGVRHIIASHYPEGLGFFKPAATWSIRTDAQTGEVIQLWHRSGNWFARDEQYFPEDEAFNQKLEEAVQFVKRHANKVAVDPDVHRARTAAELVMGKPKANDNYIEIGPELQATLPRLTGAKGRGL